MLLVKPTKVKIEAVGEQLEELIEKNTKTKMDFIIKTHFEVLLS